MVEPGKPASRAASSVSCCAAGSKEAGTVMATSCEESGAPGWASFHAVERVCKRSDKASTGLIKSVPARSLEPKGRNFARRSAA